MMCYYAISDATLSSDSAEAYDDYFIYGFTVRAFFLAWLKLLNSLAHLSY